jgi:hypothetical protein
MRNLINQLIKFKNDLTEYPYYKECKIDKSDNKLLIAYKKNTNLPDDLTYARSTIICQQTDKLLCYTLKAKQSYDKFINNNLINEITIQKYYDGTMINIYYHDDKWCLSTKTIIDGFASKWKSRKSFAELFNEIREFKYDILDKNCCYSFILQHKDNRIISQIDSNTIILVLVRNLTTNQLVNLVEYQKKGFNVPEIINNKFTSYESLSNYLEKTNLDGLMLYGDNEQRTRLMSKDYLKIQSLMGNHRDNFYNILKLQRHTDSDIHFYYSKFPEHKVIQNKLFSQINILINKIYELYVSKFIKREKSNYPKVFNTFLYQIHQTYRNRLETMNKTYAKINHRVVKAIFYKLNNYHQYQLLTQYDKYYQE